MYVFSVEHTHIKWLFECKNDLINNVLSYSTWAIRSIIDSVRMIGKYLIEVPIHFQAFHMKIIFRCDVYLIDWG